MVSPRLAEAYRVKRDRIQKNQSQSYLLRELLNVSGAQVDIRDGNLVLFAPVYKEPTGESLRYAEYAMTAALTSQAKLTKQPIYATHGIKGIPSGITDYEVTFRVPVAHKKRVLGIPMPFTKVEEQVPVSFTYPSNDYLNVSSGIHLNGQITFPVKHLNNGLVRRAFDVLYQLLISSYNNADESRIRFH